MWHLLECMFTSAHCRSSDACKRLDLLPCNTWRMYASMIIFNFQKTVRTPFLVSAGFAGLAKYLTPHHPFPRPPLRPIPVFLPCQPLWPSFNVLIQILSNMTRRLKGENCKFFTTPLSPNSQKRLEHEENQTKYIKMTRKPRSHGRI